jgi:hypothetical protein
MSALLAYVANRRRPIDRAGSQCDGLRQGHIRCASAGAVVAACLPRKLKSSLQRGRPGTFRERTVMGN